MEKGDDNISENYQTQSESLPIIYSNLADAKKVTIAALPAKKKKKRSKAFEISLNGTFIVRPSIPPISMLGVSSLPLDSVRQLKKPIDSSRKPTKESWQKGLCVDYIWFLAGQDIATKIVSYAKHISKAIAILSATGTISSVVLREATHDLIKHEGYFEIVNLNGSICSDQTGEKTGKLSVTLKSHYDNQFFGGAIGGPFVAASVVEIMIGSFTEEINPIGETSDPKRESLSHETLYPVPLKTLPLSEFNDFCFHQHSSALPLHHPPPPPPSEVSIVAETVNPNPNLALDDDDGLLSSTTETVDDYLLPVPDSEQLNYSSGNEI